MDWFRRNWPDFLIGIALVAVIAGIIATLITGGSFFPVGQNAGRTPPPGQSSSVTPGTNAPSNTAQIPGQPAIPATGAAGTTGASGASTSASNDTVPSSTGGSATPSAAPGISVLPPADSGSPASNVTPPAAAAPASSTPPAVAAPSTTTSTPVAATAASPAEDGPGGDAPYRISVGAFGQLANAQAQEAAFRAAGYPVFLAEQGDLNIVLVGPYVNEAAAQAAADKIRTGGFDIDPVIYRFRGDEDSAPDPVVSSSPSPTATATATATASPSASPAQPQTAPTSTTGRYIQVGAYGNAASAKPQSDRMTAMGYRVTERSEGELVKLLIGPFDGARLTDVKAQLAAAGIESFVR